MTKADREYMLKLGKGCKRKARYPLYKIAHMYLNMLENTDADMAAKLKAYMEKAIERYYHDFSKAALLEILLIQREVIMLHYLALKSVQQAHITP